MWNPSGPVTPEVVPNWAVRGVCVEPLSANEDAPLCSVRRHQCFGASEVTDVPYAIASAEAVRVVAQVVKHDRISEHAKRPIVRGRNKHPNLSRG